jgi:DNA (cytosine-5)-methyltransferase 1
VRVLDLFSGIGGFALGLERAGMRTVAFCEVDEFCRVVLRKRWPDVPIFEDVRTLRGADVEADVICGGFPCQDISFAGAGAGLAGERSGLWREFARLVGEIRPRYVIVENVAALLQRGIGTVLGDLAGIGYDAEWSVVSACSLGAPHVRRRLFVVAYPHGQHGRSGVWDTASRQDRAVQARDRLSHARARFGARLADPSALYGGADGLPFGMDRNRAIGNAVAPDVAEEIGRAVMRAADVRSGSPLQKEPVMR